MSFKKFLLRSLASFLVGGAAAFSGRVFASDIDLSSYDKIISNLKNDQQFKTSNGTNYNNLIKYIEKIKQQAQMDYDREKLERETRGIMKNLTPAEKKHLVSLKFGDSDFFLNETGLVPFGFDKTGVFDSFDEFFTEPLAEAILKGNKLFDKKLWSRPFGLIDCGFDVSTKLSDEALEKVSELQKAEKPGVLVCDGDGKVRANLELTEESFQQFKKDYKDLGLKIAVNNLLSRAEVTNYKLNDEDANQSFSIFISRGTKENSKGLICFSHRADGDGGCSSRALTTKCMFKSARIK